MLKRIKQIALYSLLIAYTIITLGPLFWIFTMSLRTTLEVTANPYSLPKVIQWQNYINVWVKSNYKIYFQNSAIVVSIAVVAITLIASMAAYCFARYRFPGSTFLFLAIFIAIMIPHQVTLIPLFQLMVNYKLLNTRTGLILVYIAISLPLSMYILRSFFAQIPKDIEDAARIDGCSDWSTFWRIMFPMAKPAISTIVVIHFIFLWNEFLYAVVFIQKEAMRTLPLGIMQFMGDAFEDYAYIAAGLIIAIIPTISLYAIFSEYFIKGMTAGAIK